MIIKCKNFKQKSISKPKLRKDQLNELNEILTFKIYNEPTIEVTYLENEYNQTKIGYAYKVDTEEELFYLSEGTRLRSINLKDIIEIK